MITPIAELFYSYSHETTHTVRIATAHIIIINVIVNYVMMIKRGMCEVNVKNADYIRLQLNVRGRAGIVHHCNIHIWNPSINVINRLKPVV